MINLINHIFRNVVGLCQPAIVFPAVLQISLYVVVTAGILFGFFVLFSLLARSLAMHNLFFALVKEGSAKVITHNGAFEKAIMRYEGFLLDERWNVIPSKRREDLTKAQAQEKGYKWDGKKRRKEDRWWWKLTNKFFGGGLVFVGIWPFDAVHTYQFRWEALKEGKPTAHDELLDNVFVKSSVYFTKLEGVETVGMVPLDIGLNLTIRVTNPYRSLFRAHQWLEFVVSRIAPYIRQYIPATGKEFKELVGVGQGPDSELFEFLGTSKEKFTVEQKKHLREQGRSERQIEDEELAGKGILWVLREIYGVDIQGIEFSSIVTVGKEYETAQAKKWSAEREKERIEIEATAEANKIKTIAAAEAERIRIVSKAIEDHGNVGMLSKVTDMIKDSAAKLPNWVILPSDFLDIFKKIGGSDKEGGAKK